MKKASFLGVGHPLGSFVVPNWLVASLHHLGGDFHRNKIRGSQAKICGWTCDIRCARFPPPFPGRMCLKIETPPKMSAASLWSSFNIRLQRVPRDSRKSRDGIVFSWGKASKVASQREGSFRGNQPIGFSGIQVPPCPLVSKSDMLPQIGGFPQENPNFWSRLAFEGNRYGRRLFWRLGPRYQLYCLD